MRGQGRVYKRGGVWWLDYSLGRRRFRESTEGTSRRGAIDLLRERIGHRQDGKLVGHPDRVVLAEYATGEDGNPKLVGGLRSGLERHYARAGNRSLRRARQGLDHLERYFGAATRALDITKSQVAAYLEHRLGEGAARATARYEIAILNAAFARGVEDEVLAVRPTFKLPAVANTRMQFVSDGDFAALVLSLPDWLRPLIRFLHATGWRRSEGVNLTWDAVDWEGQVIRLAGTQTKSGKPRTFPFGAAPDLKQLLETQWARRDGVFVFQRAGARLGDFRKVWASACQQAGLAGLHVHDLRRSAARAFRRAGISEGEVMKLAGWETRAMFDRYNIIDEADLAAAVAKRFANGTVAAQLAPSTVPASQLSSGATSSAA